MTSRTPESEEHLKKSIFDEMAGWKATLLSVLLNGVVAVGLNYDLKKASEEAVDVQRTSQPAQATVQSILQGLDQKDEKESEIEQAKKQFVDGLIDQYLDPESATYTGETPPIDVYLKLEAYDSTEHWLKHISTKKALDADWKNVMEERAGLWQENYEARQQALLQKDIPWTGNVETDFPLLREALFFDEGAFFANAQAPIRYAKEANEAHEQLSLAQVNCTSARFTPLILRAIYEQKGFPTEGLEKLKTITWADHIASFYDQGNQEGGVQLQEMSDEHSVFTSRASPTTNQLGTVRPLSAHLAYYLARTPHLTLDQKQRIQALGFIGDKGLYKLTPPARLSAMRTTAVHAEVQASGAKERIEERWLYNSIKEVARHDLLATGKIDTPDRAGNSLLQAPEWMQNERVRRRVVGALKAENFNGTNLKTFETLAFFYPKEAQELAKLPMEGVGPLRFAGFFGGEQFYRVPSNIMEEFIRDPACYRALEEEMLEDNRWGNASSVEKKLSLLRQFKKARELALLIDPDTKLPTLDLPEDIEAKLSLKAQNFGQNDMDEEQARIEEVLSLKGLPRLRDPESKRLDLVTVIQRLLELHPQNSEQIQKELSKVRWYFNTADCDYSLQRTSDPDVLAVLKEVVKNIYRDEGFGNSKPEEFSTQVNAWIHELMTERATKGDETNTEHLELYYMGLKELVPEEKAAFAYQKFFDGDFVLGLEHKSPSQAFITLFTNHYLEMSSPSERVDFLRGLAKKKLLIIPSEEIYPEDRQWIDRAPDDEFNSPLKLYYGAEFRPQEMSSEGLAYCSNLDPRNMQWSGASWDRVADLWEELDRRSKAN